MSRELTDKEKQRIKKLVVGNCANYRKDYGCLPLEYTVNNSSDRYYAMINYRQMFCNFFGGCVMGDKNSNLKSAIHSVGKNTSELFSKTKDAIIRTTDQNDDGKFDK